MSFTFFDKLAAACNVPLRIEQRRAPCVCSPTVKYCGVCRAWDRTHREGKCGLGGHTATTLVCFEDVGTPFWTAITAATIIEVRKLKAAGYTRQEIAEKAGVTFSMVRSALRMRILNQEETVETG